MRESNTIGTISETSESIPAHSRIETSLISSLSTNSGNVLDRFDGKSAFSKNNGRIGGATIQVRVSVQSYTDQIGTECYTLHF